MPPLDEVHKTGSGGSPPSPEIARAWWRPPLNISLRVARIISRCSQNIVVQKATPCG